MTPPTSVNPSRLAVKEAWPLLLPVWPFALVLGVAISESAFGALAGWSTSWLVDAGAAQLTLVTLFEEVGAASAIVSALVVNARHLMYSAALSRAFRQQPRWFRFLAPYLLVDQVFAVAVGRTAIPPKYFRHYYLTFGALFWTTWLMLVGAGVIAGTELPESWGLQFAVPVLFLGLAILSMTRRPAVIAGVVGFVIATLASPLPNRIGLLVGAVAGIAAGTALDRDSV